MIQAVFVSAIIVLMVETVAFFLAAYRKRNDIADVFWGIAILGAGAGAFWLTKPTDWQTLLPLVLTAVWAVRLATRIALRNFHKPPDPRYTELITEGRFFLLRSYAKVFLLQGLLATLVALPLLAASQSKIELTLPYIIGVLLWLVGFGFEVIADKQLDTFIRTKSKGILRSGLWRYSRHPNYFGEVLMWWSIWLMVSGGNYALVALIGPITITILILFVSGIPLAERQMTKKAGFESYKNTTSVFLPLPPRR